jgi:hypothetical protein
VSAILWALVWATVGAVVGVIGYLTQSSGSILDILPPPRFFWVRYVIRVALGWALVGGINGGLFALVLSFAERNRALAELTLLRMAIWGAVGTMLLPVALLLVFVVLIPSDQLSLRMIPLIAMAGLGVTCAISTLLIARRAPGSA